MEIIPLGTTQVQYDGVLDDKKFYNFIKDTLQSSGYKVMENAFVQFAGGNYHIEWTAKKLVDDYMAFRMILHIDYRGLTETSAMQAGKPVESR